MRTQFKTITIAMTGVLIAAAVAGCEPRPTAVDPSKTSLIEAACIGDLPAVQEHIAAGSDLDAQDASSGATALIAASTFGHTEVARALVEAGADLNLQNNEGATALHTAAFLGRMEIVGLLLEQGANTGLRNNAGATALDCVTAPFEDVKPIYDMLLEALGPLGLQLDYGQLEATRPRIAERLR